MPPPIDSTPRRSLQLVIHGDLRELRRTAAPRENLIVYPLTRRASVKDIIEALGIPHTDVGRIVTAAGTEVTFSYLPRGDEVLDLFPLSPHLLPTSPSVLRPQPLAELRFMADSTVGKLGRLLRMAGIDTASCAPATSLADCADNAVHNGRIVLSRNRDLLKRRRITFGRLIRSQDPPTQFTEVTHLFQLHKRFQPFSRCMICNEPLVAVVKQDIIDRLKPLTRRYYHVFKSCRCCHRLYWSGSHQHHMKRFFPPETTDPFPIDP